MNNLWEYITVVLSLVVFIYSFILIKLLYLDLSRQSTNCGCCLCIIMCNENKIKEDGNSKDHF